MLCDVCVEATNQVFGTVVALQMRGSGVLGQHGDGGPNKRSPRAMEERLGTRLVRKYDGVHVRFVLRLRYSFCQDKGL